ncbi:MAG: hypothetical protein ABR964_15955 [Tepidisphaeraceae bacterium]|jgi:hypothetical protein
MTTWGDLKEVGDLFAQKEEKVYGWMRYLVGLAAGALTILVSLERGTRTGISEFAHRSALLSLSLGILLGSLRAYAEVWFARGYLANLIEQKNRLLSGAERRIEPNVVKKPPLSATCEYLCYLCLFLALLFLVLMAWPEAPMVAIPN